MIDVNEESLTAAASKLKELLEDPDNKLPTRPTKLLVRPVDLEALGMTLEDIVKMIAAKEKNHE